MALLGKDVDHLLHLSLESGTLQWSIECKAPEGVICQYPTLDVNIDQPEEDELEPGWVPVDPPECWLENHLHLNVEDMLFCEIFDTITLDPIRSPVKVKFSCRSAAPDDSPTDIMWEVVE